MVNEQAEGIRPLRDRARTLERALDDAIRGLERATSMTLRERAELLERLRAARA